MVNGQADSNNEGNINYARDDNSLINCSFSNPEIDSGNHLISLPKGVASITRSLLVATRPRLMNSLRK